MYPAAVPSRRRLHVWLVTSAAVHVVTAVTAGAGLGATLLVPAPFFWLWHCWCCRACNHLVLLLVGAGSAAVHIVVPLTWRGSRGSSSSSSSSSAKRQLERNMYLEKRKGKLLTQTIVSLTRRRINGITRPDSLALELLSITRHAVAGRLHQEWKRRQSAPSSCNLIPTEPRAWPCGHPTW